MALPVITDTFRVAGLWQHSSTGQTAVNVMHFRSSTGDADDLAGALDAHIQTNQLDCVSNLASVIEWHITPLDGTSATRVYPTTAWPGDGTSGDFVPAGSAVVSLYTNKRGRSYRGRIYLPFLPESQSSDGQLASGAPSAMVAAWTAFQVALEAGSPTWTQVVASYKHATAEDVISYAVRVGFGTQRRRQERVRY